MPLDSNHVSPEQYETLVILSESMIARNNIIEILGEIKKGASILTQKRQEILIHKFLAKIALIDRQMSRVATGLSCSVCEEKLSLNDLVLICIWCGSPAHSAHLLKYVKDEGYCPACGQYLKLHFKSSLKTITPDLFKTIVYAFSNKIHEIQVFFGETLLDQAKPVEKVQCPECKRQTSADWKFCRYCGTRIEEDGIQEVQMISCSRCGRQITGSWHFCKWCGQPTY